MNLSTLAAEFSPAMLQCPQVCADALGRREERTGPECVVQTGRKNMDIGNILRLGKIN